MKKKKYRVKTKRNLFFRIIGSILKILIRKPGLVNLSGEELPKKAIYLMNHEGARGPMVFELYFPKRATPWGAHEMCGNYRERWKYLYHVFYRQKLHYGKFRSFITATLFGIVSGWLYNSVGLIGTYRDARLIETIRNSYSVLENNQSIVIFPENSDKGYKEMPIAFNRGFITLAKSYFKKTGEDLPIYTVYYSRKKSKFIVGTPGYVNRMLSDGGDERETAEIFLRKCRELYEICKNGKIDKKGKVCAAEELKKEIGAKITGNKLIKS